MSTVGMNDDDRNSLADTAAGQPVDVESGRPTVGRARPMPVCQMKKVLHDENPYTLALTIISEFLAVLTLGLVIQFARGFYPGDQDAAGLAIGAGYMGAYFFFSTMETNVHLFPVHTILHMIFKNEALLSGFLRLLVQFVGAFAVAGISLPILDSAYVNTAIHPGSGTSVGETIFVESFGEIFFGLAAVQLANYGERGVSVPLSALILGITTVGFQIAAYPASAASFNIFRWLATNLVGGDLPLYFGDDWWAYLLSPVIALIVVGVLNCLIGWLKESARDWTPKKYSSY